LQADGKILVGGWFETLGGQPRGGIARLNADGTLDSGFNPGAVGGMYMGGPGVSSLAVQVDGKVLVGGRFETLNGQIRTNIARLNADGTLDSRFNPAAGGPFFPSVFSLAVQADGKILVCGQFDTLARQSCGGFGRLNNSALATQSLSFDGSTITWLRGGTSPEVWRTTFEYSTNNLTWTSLGAGTRITGGWQMSGPSLPPNRFLRARGYVAGGYQNASGWFVEAGCYYGLPMLLSQPASRTNDAGTTASFSVLATGSEPLRYQWRKDGVPLADGGNVAGARTAVLLLTNMLGGDAGGYSVLVTNGFGSVTSAVARLTVLDPAIAVQPVSQRRDPGQSVTLSVAATGTAPFGYQWWKDGLVLPQATNASLLLTNLQASDSGQYRVVVRNGFGSLTSTVALLTVDNPVTLDSGFNPGPGGLGYPHVSSLAVQADGKILVGGQFTTLGGQTRNCLGRLNADGTLDSGFNPGAGGFSEPDVYSLAVQADGKILVGGWFTSLGGQTRNYIGRLNADGTVDSGFNPGAGGFSYPDVYSLAVQAGGKILVGGYFTTLGGQTRNYIGRLNADGTVDSGFNPGANNYVFSLALQADGKILVGGLFTTLGGQPRNYLGRLNPDGSLDSGFNLGANNLVYSLAVQADGRILVGGQFTTLGGQTRNYIGRLNADGTVDSGFNPGANDYVSSLAVQADGRILVGGQFTMLGGQTRNYLGRLNPDGSLDSGFNPGANNYVISLTVQADGKILVGGWFTSLGGQTRNYLGRLNNTAPATQSLSFDGSTITWLRGGTSPEVWRTAFEHSTNGVTWTSLGAGTRITGGWQGWQLSGLSLPPSGTLRARGNVTGGYRNASSWFVEAFHNQYYGPVFLSQPASRTNDAATTATFSLLATGSEPLSYQWRKEGVPLVDGGSLSGARTAVLMLTNVLGGDAGGYSVVVTNAFGGVTSAVARLTVIDPVITVQPVSQSCGPGKSVTFSVTAAGTAPFGYQWCKDDLALPQATNSSLLLTNLQANHSGEYRVVVSNGFGSVTSAVALLTVENPVTLDSAFNPGAGGTYPYVYSLAVQVDGKILVGGIFTTLGGQTRNCLGRLNADGTLDSEFNPGAGGVDYPDVSSLAVQADGKILVGGNFTTLSGQTRTYIGRVNADGTLDSGFNPGANRYVYSLAVQADGKILVGGTFTMLGGQTRYLIGRVNADGTLDSGFNPGPGGFGYPYVSSLAVQADGKILVGGNFTTLAGQPATNIARLNVDGTLDSGFNPGADKYVLSLAVQADGKILVGGYFTTLGGQARNCIGRLNADGTLDSGFNPGAGGVDSYDVSSLAVQADGKILVGGNFTTLGGQTRNYLGRLNADGTLDSGFNPGAGGGDYPYVYSLAVQADGRILVGGNFTMLGGQTRNYLGRLNNTAPATQTLSFDGSTITWLRGGTSPEVWRTAFEQSTNGVTWTGLGAGTRIIGGWQGWQLPGLSLPPNGTLRARGYVACGYQNASGWFVEATLPLVRPFSLSYSRDGSNLVLSWTGGQGPYQVQQTTRLDSSNYWQNVGPAVTTNLIWLRLGSGNLFLRVRGQ
jgi:uncharacterized delta-60 repeat protein